MATVRTIYLDGKPYIKTCELASTVGFTIEHVRKLVTQNRLPSRKIGHRRWFNVDDVLAALERPNADAKQDYNSDTELNAKLAGIL